MSVGIVNRTVKAIRNARKLKEIARTYERQRKAKQRPPVVPLTREQRIRNYANQIGWTAEFTPAQRRRLDHKNRRAMGQRMSSWIVDETTPFITKVDGTKAFEEIK